MSEKRNVNIVHSIAILLILTLTVSLEAALRKAKVSDKMPPFTLVDIQGKKFSYQHGKGRVLVVAFFAAEQKHSERVALDMQRVLSEITDKNEQSLDMVAVTTDVNTREYFLNLSREDKLSYPILLDGDFKLWGELGVIAAPTVVLVDKNDTIAWINAGHGYDFLPALRTEVDKALGLKEKDQLKTGDKVEALINATKEARMKRHLKMAQMLKEKGRLESAAAELQKALELTPDSFEVRSVMAEVFCQIDQPDKALKVVEKLTAESRKDSANLDLVRGWAYRLKGEQQRAEKLLTASLKTNPQSARALFELGKIYQDRREFKRAMVMYHRALAVNFHEATPAEILNIDK